MPLEHVASDWNTYRAPAGPSNIPGSATDLTDRSVVESALAAMSRALVIRSGQVDEHRYLGFQRSTSVLMDAGPCQLSPRIQRLLYGIVAIQQPMSIVAADCGDAIGLLICAGPALGCQPIYHAQAVTGFEPRLSEAARAERNVRNIDHHGLISIFPEDAVSGISRLGKSIDLLLLGHDEIPDTNRHQRYLQVLKTALPCMKPGAMVVAIGSMSASVELRQYQAFVRNTDNMSISMNVVLDHTGCEISVR